MELIEKVRELLQQLVVPELENLRQQVGEVRLGLELTHKRLDDVTVYLADQSRRLDAFRQELSERIDATNQRIDETNQRMDALQQALSAQIEHANQRIDALRQELSARVDDANNRADGFRQELMLLVTRTREELTGRMDRLRDDLAANTHELHQRLDRMNELMAQIALAVARREDQERLERRIAELEKEMILLKEKVA